MPVSPVLTSPRQCIGQDLARAPFACSPIRALPAIVVIVVFMTLNHPLLHWLSDLPVLLRRLASRRHHWVLPGADGERFRHDALRLIRRSEFQRAGSVLMCA